MLTTPLYFFLFFFNDTATTEIYTLSLHDALPISLLFNIDTFNSIFAVENGHTFTGYSDAGVTPKYTLNAADGSLILGNSSALRDRKSTRLNSSHQIISYAVFCLKKKKFKTKNTIL